MFTRFGHVSACISTLLLYRQLIFHRMDVPHFIHSLVDEHLACIHFFALMSNAAMNTYAQVCV